MPPIPGPPLRKVTLNLYEEDCVEAERRFGHGWSSELRELIHTALRAQRRKIFLGDLE